MGNTNARDPNDPNKIRSLTFAPSYPIEKELNESEIVDLTLAIIGYSITAIIFEVIMSNLSVLAGVNRPGTTKI